MQNEDRFRGRRAVKLEQGDLRSTTSPNLIRSGGLGPCIAIGAYNHILKKGYMVHDPCPSVSGMIPRFIEKVTRKCGDISEVVLYATGAAPEKIPPDLKENIEENREFVRTELLKFFKPEQVIFDWTDMGYSNELFLDTRTGEFYTDPRANNFEDEINL